MLEEAYFELRPKSFFFNHWNNLN